MVESQIKLVRQYCENLIAFLQPLLPLANCHMVDFFTKSAYMKYVPLIMREEMETCGLQNVINNIFNDDYADLPILKSYVDKCGNFTLKNSNLCLPVSTFCEKLKSFGCENFDSLKLNVFMTTKKSHEVEISSALIAALNQAVGTSYIVDIGDGKGYLSSLLAYYYNFKVLGVDASDINTEGSVKRATKLVKHWKRFIEPSNKHIEIKSVGNKNFNLYKQVTQFIDDQINVEDLISNVFLDKPSNLGIVGLHTCGNLGATSVKLFHKTLQAKTLCNVSCCYHLLTERFESEVDEIQSSSQNGFPLSQLLIDMSFSIGRRARMTGAQSFDRIINNKELPNINIFYRAILQVILEENCEKLPTNRVGKIKKCSDFLDYTRQALAILECEVKLSDESINEYHEMFCNKLNELYAFYLVRSMLSSVVETLILTDRLLYLLEKGYSNSFLVQLFDPIISPRCYGLICIK